MNWHLIQTLVFKDLTLFFRDRFFALITILALVVYTGIYFAMPGTVTEKFEIALYATTLPQALAQRFEERSIKVTSMDSETAVKTAVLDGSYRAGIVLPSDLMDILLAGQTAQVAVYFSSNTPSDLDDAFATLLSLVFNDIGYAISGQSFSIEVNEEILGPDMTGRQITQRDRMLPLFAILLLMMETLGLASLITEERERRTLQALLITPLNLNGLFIGKAITGVGLAFVQAVILVAITGGLAWQPGLVIITLLLGAFLITGIGFMIASVATDMMSVIGWGMVAIIVLSIPSFSIMFPGTITQWVKVIPTYYLIDTIHQLVNFQAGWTDIASNLLVLVLLSLAFLGAGVIILGRKLK